MDLNPIFYPSTIAVVGVSSKNYHNPGTVVFRKNLLIKGFMDGKVFGINPNGGKVEGMTLHKRLHDIPIKVDLGVFCVRAKHTVRAIEDAINLGVKGGIIISGGFSEVGASGKNLQEEIVKLSNDNDFPIIGPNCVGVYNPGNVNTFFIPSERFVVPEANGNVSIVSQSGGILADQFFAKYLERNIGISKAVSVGNKAVLDEVDMLEYFTTDPETEVIGFYLEGFAKKRGKAFLDMSRQTNKTILMLKGGKTEKGMKAALSHTSAVSGENKILEGALKQYGIILCANEQELITFSETFSLLSGKNKPFFSKEMQGTIVIITISGGHGVLSSDMVKDYNLKMVELTESEKEELRGCLNPSASGIASLGNPIDLTGSVTDDDVVNVLDWFMKTDKVDIILLLILPYPPGITINLGSRIASVVRMYRKPVICYLPWLARYQMIIEPLNETHIPVGNSIEEALLMAHAVNLKSKALERTRFNKMLDTESEIVEDYDNLKKRRH
ncbi:MAG: CoA-binding protein [Candidatus Hodarchaeota archaeon]